MPSNNSPVPQKAKVEPLHKRCRGAGSMGLPHIDTTPVQPSSATPFFQPRAFPPPALTGVPMEYITSQLRSMAPNYWDKPDTADCTLMIPVPHPRANDLLSPAFTSGSFMPTSPRPSIGNSTAGRRESEPALNTVPRMSMKLHIDYLSAHSTLLRGLFSGATPLGLINSSLDPSSSVPTTSGKFTIPANRLPKLMPSDTNHPILFLPVPDPSSMHLLFHWMYFGSTTYIEEALNKRIVQWEGLARNVEYLGLSTEIKIFLGRWYGTWLHPERARASDQIDDEDIDSDSDTAYSDMEEDDDDSLMSDSMDLDDAEYSPIKDDDASRGRNRSIRCLSWPGPDTQQDPDFCESLATAPTKPDSGLDP